MHEGHRQRMLAKLSNDDDLYDHELLEILLFFVCPRKNTNPLAHELLDRFGSLKEVFNATDEEIKSVFGAGSSVANYLKALGRCYERIGNVEGVAVLKTFGDCKKFVSMRFKNVSEEKLELYFLDRGGKVKRQFSYTSFDRNKASVTSHEVIKKIALVKPYSIIVAHNHLNGSVNPSANDDKFTGRMQIICNLNNVVLLDHLIYSDGNFYSYKDAGRLNEIKSRCTLDNFFNG